MPQGNVYVFNATPESVALILNNFVLAGSVAGISQPDGYRAASVQVLRSIAPIPGGPQFGERNTLIVAARGGQAYAFEVVIEGEQPAADLQLYVTFGAALLITPSGTGTVIQAGEPSAEQMALVESSAGG